LPDIPSRAASKLRPLLRFPAAPPPAPRTARDKHPPKHQGLLPRSLDNALIDLRDHSTPGTLASSPQTPPPPLSESSRPALQTAHAGTARFDTPLASDSIHPGFAGARRVQAKATPK